MKVLSIGNSFSTDATAYLHRAAVSAGVDLDTYNLWTSGDVRWNATGTMWSVKRKNISWRSMGKAPKGWYPYRI